MARLSGSWERGNCRDPLRALEAVRGVCGGHLIVLDTVSGPLSMIPSPVARLDARRDGSEWFVFNRRGLKKALELAGFAVEAMTPIFRDRYGPPGEKERVAPGARAMYIAGLRGRSVAARARPSPRYLSIARAPTRPHR